MKRRKSSKKLSWADMVIMGWYSPAVRERRIPTMFVFFRTDLQAPIRDNIPMIFYQEPAPIHAYSGLKTKCHPRAHRLHHRYGSVFHL